MNLSSDSLEGLESLVGLELPHYHIFKFANYRILTLANFQIFKFSN